MYTIMCHIKIRHIVLPFSLHDKTKPISSHTLGQIVPVRLSQMHIHFRNNILFLMPFVLWELGIFYWHRYWYTNNILTLEENTITEKKKKLSLPYICLHGNRMFTKTKQHQNSHSISTCQLCNLLPRLAITNFLTKQSKSNKGKRWEQFYVSSLVVSG